MHRMWRFAVIASGLVFAEEPAPRSPGHSLLVALDPDDVRTRLTRAALAIDQKRPSLAAADLARLETQTLDENEAAVAKRLRSALPATPQ